MLRVFEVKVYIHPSLKPCQCGPATNMRVANAGLVKHGCLFQCHISFHCFLYLRKRLSFTVELSTLALLHMIMVAAVPVTVSAQHGISVRVLRSSVSVERVMVE